MMSLKNLLSLAVAGLFAISMNVNAFVTPCVYQQYKCGYSMIADNGYTVAELTSAVNQTGATIPPLTDDQLLAVLYRCRDVTGGIVGNSFCISGCLNMANNTLDDMCAF